MCLLGSPPCLLFHYLPGFVVWPAPTCDSAHACMRLLPLSPRLCLSHSLDSIFFLRFESTACLSYAPPLLHHLVASIQYLPDLIPQLSIHTEDSERQRSPLLLQLFQLQRTISFANATPDVTAVAIAPDSNILSYRPLAVVALDFSPPPVSDFSSDIPCAPSWPRPLSRPVSSKLRTPTRQQFRAPPLRLRPRLARPPQVPTRDPSPRYLHQPLPQLAGAAALMPPAEISQCPNRSRNCLPNSPSL